MAEPQKRSSRIQQKNRQVILDAALREFSARGFAGATIDQIADAARLSKPNVLYYFASKESIYRQLLEGLLDLWLAPLREICAEGEPREQILNYMRRKMEMSRTYTLESRLFAYEILQGAPQLESLLEGGLRELVDEKAGIIQVWMEEGRIPKMDPRHLIISIWALTQHYADFEAQVRAILDDGSDPFATGEAFLEGLYDRLLRV